MKIRYTGGTARLLIHEGVPYDVYPGMPDLELPSLPSVPGFEEVKQKTRPPDQDAPKSDDKGDGNQ